MQSNPQIATLCLNIIAKYAVDSIKWNEFQRYRDSYYSTIISRSIPQSRKDEHGSCVTVVPLKNGFCLYVKIVFEYPNSSCLKALTLHFYDQEELVLRADWSYQDYIQKTHAQPHWHMGSKLSVVEDKVQPAKTFSDFTTSYSTYQAGDHSEILIDINRLHLYMAYDVKNQSSLDFRDKSILLQWLEYTMSYLDDQFWSLKDHHTV